MENIDDRDIDAARFCRNVELIFSESNTETDAGLRVTALLLFTILMQRDLDLPWLLGEFEDPRGLESVRSRAYKWLGVENIQFDNWINIPSKKILELFHLIRTDNNEEILLKRLDFIVLRLGDSGLKGHSLSRRVERFLVDFMKSWDLSPSTVIDFNGITNGEIGVELNLEKKLKLYELPRNNDIHIFEVCLRLKAHNLNYRFYDEPFSNFNKSAFKLVCGFPKVFTYAQKKYLSGINSQIYKNPLYITKKMVWEENSLVVVVLPSRNLRVLSDTFEVRHELLKEHCIVGALDLPSRVVGRLKLSILVAVRKKLVSPDDSIFFINGRAIDGLRDESLGHLAQFLGIPFAKALNSASIIDAYNFDDISDSLKIRAKKMFYSELNEMPGFFQYEYTRDVINTENYSLDPSDWVKERESFISSDLLDGRLVQELLTEPDRPGCIYVIGNNGVGKSMLLRQMAKGYSAVGRAVRAIASASSDRFDIKNHKKFDYQYLGSRTSDVSTQPRKLGEQLAVLIGLIYEEQNRIDIFNNILELLSFSGHYYLLPESAESDIFESLREFGRDKIPKNLKGWKLGFRKINTYSIIPFDHLSTGEQQILLLTARLVKHAAKGVIFLVDEPETSLHVSWQRSLPLVFKTISTEFSCQIVVATHSPVLISTARGEDTYCFIAEGGVLEEIDDQGSNNVERVLFQGFDTYTENNREVHERCAELVSNAIELANTFKVREIQKILDELQTMENKVFKSIPLLGEKATYLHLNLIRRATGAVEGLIKTVNSLDQIQ